MTTDIMTVKEVAEWLKCSPAHIVRCIKRDGLPAFKLGGDYRLKKDLIEQWMRHQSAQGGVRPRGKPRMDGK